MATTPSRSEQTLIGAEREQLEAFLEDNRSELAGALTRHAGHADILREQILAGRPPA